MSTLSEILIKKRLVKDPKSATPLIEEGFVKLHRVLMTQDLPIAKEDEGGVEVDPIGKRLASVPYSYWRFFEMQRKWEIFKPTSDALCFGLDEGELQFLSDTKTSVHAVFLPNEPAWKIKNINVVRANPIFDDLSYLFEKKLFNMLICGLETSLYNIYAVLGRYARLMMSGSKILHKVVIKGESFEQQKGTIEHLAKGLGLIFVDEIKPKYSRYETWVLLKKG